MRQNELPNYGTTAQDAMDALLEYHRLWGEDRLPEGEDPAQGIGVLLGVLSGRIYDRSKKGDNAIACQIDYWTEASIRDGADPRHAKEASDFMFRICSSPTEWEIAGIRFAQWLREQQRLGRRLEWDTGAVAPGELFSVHAGNEKTGDVA